MARIIIQELVIFLLPILLYLAYMSWKRRQARLTGMPEPPWERGHWYWLVVIGLALSIVAFIVLEAVVSQGPAVPYRPPTSTR
jgi:TRAP-type C4-dicarboxylate transport system permease small subunit